MVWKDGVDGRLKGACANSETSHIVLFSTRNDAFSYLIPKL
jgi:hypothetical protein